MLNVIINVEKIQNNIWKKRLKLNKLNLIKLILKNRKKKHMKTIKEDINCFRMFDK